MSKVESSKEGQVQFVPLTGARAAEEAKRIEALKLLSRIKSKAELEAIDKAETKAIEELIAKDEAVEAELQAMIRAEAEANVVEVKVPGVVVEAPKVEVPKHRSMKAECKTKAKAWGVKPKKAMPKVIRVGSQLAFALADAGVDPKKLPSKTDDEMLSDQVDSLIKAIGK